MKINITMKNIPLTYIIIMTGMVASFLIPLKDCYAQKTNSVIYDTSTEEHQIKDHPLECGPQNIDTAALNVAMAYETQNQNRLLPPSFSVRVFFHILRYDNGTNATTTAAAVQNEFNTLVNDFAANNICFINCGYDFIDNTALDTNFNADTDPFSVFDPYRVPNCLNIFYLKNIKGSNSANGGGYGGIAFGIPSIACLVSKNNIGGRTTSHEVGHCFGLLHTFEPAYGRENINGSNSSSAADKITDTPADPYRYRSQACFSASNGVYTGTCTDPNGQSNFNPPYDNIMSYWSKQVFTSGQFTRVNSFLSTEADLIGCESRPAIVINPATYSSGYVIASSIAPLTTNGTINVINTAKVILIAETVILSPGFIATPALNGLLLLRNPACGNFIPRIEAAQNPFENSGTNLNALKCYPNPFSENITIEFDLLKDDDASIQLFDIMGKEVQTISKLYYPQGRHNIIINTSDLTAGIYFAVLQGSDFRMEQKIVKTN